MKKLLAVLVLSLLAFPVFAQSHHRDGKSDTEAAKHGDFPFIPPLPVKAGSVQDFLTTLADISGAITLSTQIPSLQDPVGNACWQQFAGIAALIKAHPLPLNLKVASDIEAARLLAIALNQICANPNCGQMWVDASNTANALVGAPIPMSLASVCAKVPVIGTNAVPTSPASKAQPIGTLPTPVVTPKAAPAPKKP
jgi:hypothetical protein